VFQEFPKWVYHKELPAMVVDDPQQQEDLGPGWAESPAHLVDVPKKKVKK
jgi:hypothetical protein